MKKATFSQRNHLSPAHPQAPSIFVRAGLFSLGRGLIKVGAGLTLALILSLGLSLPARAAQTGHNEAFSHDHHHASEPDQAQSPTPKNAPAAPTKPQEGHNEAFIHESESNSAKSPTAEPNSSPQGLYSVRGVIQALDAPNHKISVTHEPIAALNWPAMTMTFKVADLENLRDLAVGDQILMDFQAAGSDYLIVFLEKE
ncbi:MAG: copper-binding protein [Deltaproteobacteria bacterium]|jgi:Cu/Ag efflux protein CusF|nr:copper-binding protein [Deltaproteobacteria bacterium]